MMNRRQILKGTLLIMIHGQEVLAEPPINGDELIGFLGHASKNSPLDSYLNTNGMKKRPRASQGVYLISENGKGLHFQYHDAPDYEERYPDPPLSAGDYILTNIDFTSHDKKKERPFTGTLPFGLSFNLARSEVHRALSTPVVTLEPDQNRGHLEIFAKNNLRITVSFHIGDLSIDWMRVFLAEKGE